MESNISIEIHSRPTGAVRDEIVSIVKGLTSDWFTQNVPEDTFSDLIFQDVLILKHSTIIESFIMYTCHDGIIQISLMGTRKESRGKGYGSQLIEAFFKHIKKMGFRKIIVYTVPPDMKIAYRATLTFYQKHGFIITRRYNELWEHGAIQLLKDL